MEISSSTHWNNRLRQERIAHNWRQQDLADQLGTTVVTVKRWERGSQHPSAYFRVKLCALFGKSAEELFGEFMSQEDKTLIPPPQISQPDSSSESESLVQNFVKTKSRPLETVIPKTSLPISQLSSVSVEAFFSKVFPSFQKYSPGKKSPSLIRGTLLLLSLLIALAISLKFTIFLPGRPSLKFPSPQNVREVQDSNLSLRFVDVMSPSFALFNKPKSHSEDNTNSRSISAVLLAKTPSTYDKIIIEVRNLRQTGVDILIDSVALKLLSVPQFPQPLKVWNPGITTTYMAYPYPILYQGQTPDQLLYADPPQKVILQSEESEKLSLQVLSTVVAYLQFRIQILYQIADTNTQYLLTLPQTFQVVFLTPSTDRNISTK